MEMYRGKVLDGQLAALANIDYKKKLAKVRARMEEVANQRTAQKKGN